MKLETQEHITNQQGNHHTIIGIAIKLLSKILGKEEKQKSNFNGENLSSNLNSNQENLNKLYGKKDEILEDLKSKIENNIERDVEIYGKKGDIIHIDLPAVGDFGGFNFNCFVSKDFFGSDYLKSHPKYDETLSSEDAEKEPEMSPEFDELSYSLEDIVELLKNMNDYMKALGVKMDNGIDFEKDLKNWENSVEYIINSDTGDCLRKIGLDGSFWIKNIAVKGKENSHLARDNYNYKCYFDYYDYACQLLLKCKIKNL